MITLGPSLTGPRGIQVTGSIIYTLVTKKTTKLMKHLGGCGKMDYVEWFPGSCRRTFEPPGVSHLWMATQEQRDWRRSSREASTATTSHMGSVLTN
jgi:hypothetical protein